MDLVQRIADILLEMRSASLSIQGTTSKQAWDDIMDRYGMRFMGPKFNEIYSDELMQTLSNKFDIDIDLETLNNLLPDICSKLEMKSFPAVAMKDISKSDPAVHSLVIHLH